MIRPSNEEMEKTYRSYLSEIGKMDIQDMAPRLGLEPSGKGRFTFRLFNSEYYYCKDGFFTSDDQKPAFDICIILSKYLLLCPKTEPEGIHLVSFKDFKDSGPLTVYFSADIEQKLCKSFSGRLNQLGQSSKKIGGQPALLEAEYDLMMHFSVLPKIPIVMLFNDKDDEFEAETKLLFESRAETYLDAECLAMLGSLLCRFLDNNKTG